jgi:GT2 family glycosyltransferase
MPPRVVLLILTWNRRDDVLRCVASLPRLAYPNVTPVVIDNASQDDTVAALRARHPELTILENRANLGYAGGNNVGIRWALERGADYVQLINSDTEVTAQLTGELVRVADTDSRIAVVGCRNVLMEDPTRLWGAYSTLTYGPFLVRSDGAGGARRRRMAGGARCRCRDRQWLPVAAGGAGAGRPARRNALRLSRGHRLV